MSEFRLASPESAFKEWPVKQIFFKQTSYLDVKTGSLNFRNIFSSNSLFVFHGRPHGVALMVRFLCWSKNYKQDFIKYFCSLADHRKHTLEMGKDLFFFQLVPEQ